MSQNRYENEEVRHIFFLQMQVRREKEAASRSLTFSCKKKGTTKKGTTNSCHSVRLFNSILVTRHASQSQINIANDHGRR